eukprot:scaffold15188_cov85-Isochrysis_galbana.AAC.1
MHATRPCLALLESSSHPYGPAPTAWHDAPRISGGAGASSAASPGSCADAHPSRKARTVESGNERWSVRAGWMRSAARSTSRSAASPVSVRSSSPPPPTLPCSCCSSSPLPPTSRPARSSGLRAPSPGAPALHASSETSASPPSVSSTSGEANTSAGGISLSDTSPAERRTTTCAGG